MRFALSACDAASTFERSGRALRVADVACYKALLALHLVQRDPSVRVVATDLASGPLELGRVVASGLPTQQCQRIDFRLGDGLSALAPGEVDVVCIAGVAAGMLSTWIPSAQFTKRLVLQPSVPTAPQVMMALRRTLCSRGWSLQDEALSMEKGGTCVTLMAEAADVASLEEVDTILPAAPRRRVRHKLQSGFKDDLEVKYYLELLNEYLERLGPGSLSEALHDERASVKALEEAAQPCSNGSK